MGSRVTLSRDFYDDDVQITRPECGCVVYQGENFEDFDDFPEYEDEEDEDEE